MREVYITPLHDLFPQAKTR